MSIDNVAMRASLNTLNENISNLRTFIRNGGIKCSDDVKEAVEKVQVEQNKIKDILEQIKQNHESKRQELEQLRKTVQNVEKDAKADAESKVRMKGNIEKWVTIVMSWWWAYLMVEKYVFPYFY